MGYQENEMVYDQGYAKYDVFIPQQEAKWKTQSQEPFSCTDSVRHMLGVGIITSYEIVQPTLFHSIQQQKFSGTYFLILMLLFVSTCDFCPSASFEIQKAQSQVWSRESSRILLSSLGLEQVGRCFYQESQGTG